MICGLALNLSEISSSGLLEGKFGTSTSYSFTMHPSKEASRILTTFGCRHSVRILISVNKHSTHSFLLAIFLTLIILIATCFLVYKSIASFTLYYWQKRKLGYLNLGKLIEEWRNIISHSVESMTSEIQKSHISRWRKIWPPTWW